MFARWTLALVLLHATAHAEPERASKAARSHYAEATKAYNLGEFQHAADEYREAYRGAPDPNILYNIAQSYRLANVPSQALFFYRSYLRNVPDTTNRKEVEERIRKLEEQISPKAAAPAAPPAVVADPLQRLEGYFAGTSRVENGHTAAAALGAGTPAYEVHGSGSLKRVGDRLLGSYHKVYGDNAKILDGMMEISWDESEHSYRIATADQSGRLEYLGHFDEAHGMIAENANAASKYRVRLVWTWRSANVAHFRVESLARDAVPNTPWFVGEEEDLVRVEPGR